MENPREKDLPTARRAESVDDGDKYYRPGLKGWAAMSAVVSLAVGAPFAFAGNNRAAERSEIIKLTHETAGPEEVEIKDYDADFDEKCMTSATVDVKRSSARDWVGLNDTIRTWNEVTTSFDAKKSYCVEGGDVKKFVNETTGSVRLDIPKSAIYSRIAVVPDTLLVETDNGKGWAPVAAAVPILKSAPWVQDLDTIKKFGLNYDKNASELQNRATLAGLDGFNQACNDANWELSASSVEQKVTEIESRGLDTAKLINPDFDYSISMTIDGQPVDEIEDIGTESNLSDIFDAMHNRADTNKDFTFVKGGIGECKMSDDVTKQLDQARAKGGR